MFCKNVPTIRQDPSKLETDCQQNLLSSIQPAIQPAIQPPIQPPIHLLINHDFLLLNPLIVDRLPAASATR